MYNVAVIGAGAWGSAIAHLLAQKDCAVHLWARREEVAQQINHEHQNPTFLPGLSLSENIVANHHLHDVVCSAPILVMVIPSHATRQIASLLQTSFLASQKIVILTKGIEQKTLNLMSEIYTQELNVKVLAFLSGPNFATEIAKGQPAASTLFCENAKEREELQRLFHTSYFRIYGSHDLKGAQIAGALKNVIAIVSGASDGMGLGASARASLICRGLAEIKRLGLAMGGVTETFAGLAGVGDLTLTATDLTSRNYSLGFALGQGQQLSDYLVDKRSVAEGIKTSVAVHALSQKYQLPMPLCHASYQLTQQAIPPIQIFEQLLARKLPEFE